MSTSAVLLQILNLKTERDWYVREQIANANKMEINTEQLGRQQNYQEAWDKAYQDAIDGPGKDLVINGRVIVSKDTPASERAAITWANYKSKYYDEDLLDRLTDADVEYDTTNELLGTLIKELDADIAAEEEELGNEAGKTGLIGGGG